MGANQLPLIFRSTDRWSHLPGQEQNHYYQDYGQRQKSPSTIKRLSRPIPKSSYKILTSKTCVS